MRFRKYLVLLKLGLFLGITYPTFETAAQCPESQEITPFDSQSIFNTDTTTGSLAIMPNVKAKKEAKAATKYNALIKNGVYYLGGINKNSWFVNNHRVGETKSTATYLGVLVAKVQNKDKLENRLQLFRNEGWYGFLERSSLKETEDQFQSAEKFFCGHRKLTNSSKQSESGQSSYCDEGENKISGTSVKAFNKEFRNWHALTNIQDPELSSWESQIFWDDDEHVEDKKGEYDFLNCLKEISGDDNLNSSRILVQARLLKFTPTTSKTSNKPVAWNIDLSDTEAIYIMTFSPTIDIEREYYIGICENLEDSQYC